MKKNILVSILFFTAAALSQNANLGTSAAKFLQIPISARASGMGGAYIATADDATSLFWNPAGSAKIESDAAHFSYLNLYSQFDFNAAAISHYMGDAGVISGSFISLSMGKTEITTEEQPNGTGRYYDAQDLALGLTYAVRLSNEFNIGITAKYIHQRIWNETAEGIAFDIGTQYRVDFNNLIIAMCMTNFGSDLRFDGEDLNINYLRNQNYPISRLAPGRLQTSDDPLPLNFQIGAAMDFYNDEMFTLRGEIDASHPNDNNERLNAGIEASFYKRIFLRVGERINYDDENLTFGAGVTIPLMNSNIRFDFSYANFILLPDLYRYSIEIEF
ncbi:MAG: PorV/PorQ family protein [Bacteroidetes bacterium]|nr:PorV/PorQ family protein [Bacteroidota bacterium]